VYGAMQAIAGVTPYPSQANFITFTSRIAPKTLFEAIFAHGILIRDVSAAVPNALRVSIGNTQENDRFLAALQEIMREEKER
jgi:histidinol-phosphate aminotransferase